MKLSELNLKIEPSGFVDGSYIITVDELFDTDKEALNVLWALEELIQSAEEEEA